MSEARIEEITYAPDELVVTWADGAVSRVDAIWLRDYCQMATSRAGTPTYPRAVV